jgi:hypothetical protein
LQGDGMSRIAVAAAACDACTALHAFPKLKMLCYLLEFMVAPHSEIFVFLGDGSASCAC